ncbi:MAG: metallophosphatase family protein [Solirubrobacteraceae bacterium]|nr:metallophosphatase family protein [Solirubrobacteraceae bacterium]
MRTAILSDIHANRHALEAVLADVEASGAQRIWCLGDVVGYGADPGDCIDLVRANADLCLAGNHDLAVTGALAIDDFALGAAIAAEWTREVLSAERISWLGSLDSSADLGDMALYHASPRDPVWEYVLGVLLAELCMDAMSARIGLIGHSHVALSFRRPDGEAATGTARRTDEIAQLGGDRWLLNPGSVGQPRDGDPRAAWLLLDDAEGTAQWRRTRYDVEAAAAAIRAARLPDSLAERLQYGQ